MSSFNLEQRIKSRQKTNRRTLAVFQVLRKNGRTQCERMHSSVMVATVGPWFSQAPLHIQGSVECSYHASGKGDNSTTSFELKGTDGDREYARIGRVGGGCPGMSPIHDSRTAVFNRLWSDVMSDPRHTRASRQLLAPIEAYITYHLKTGAGIDHLEFTDDNVSVLLSTEGAKTSIQVTLDTLFECSRQTFGTAHVMYH